MLQCPRGAGRQFVLVLRSLYEPGNRSIPTPKRLDAAAPAPGVISVEGRCIGLQGLWQTRQGPIKTALVFTAAGESWETLNR